MVHIVNHHDPVMLTSIIKAMEGEQTEYAEYEAYYKKKEEELAKQQIVSYHRNHVLGSA